MDRFKWSKCLNLNISKVIFGINLKIYNMNKQDKIKKVMWEFNDGSN